jgi:hypothetical protein
MAAQHKGWGYSNGVGDEESCGEALSLFLTVQFQISQGLGQGRAPPLDMKHEKPQCLRLRLRLRLLKLCVRFSFQMSTRCPVGHLDENVSLSLKR